MSFDTKHELSTRLQVTLQLPEEEEIVQAEPHRYSEDSIDAIMMKNGFGKLCKMAGAHEQPDNKLLDILNMESHEKPELLSHIAELLSNGIVRCKNVLIKVLTMEAYSSHASVDIHNESQVLESTLPVQGRLFCGTVSAADGKGLKQKMVIVSKTMNALCTCSVTLGATPQVSISPGHAYKLNPQDCRLFLASAAVSKFKEMVAPENDLLLTRTPSMSHLRQLTTSFHHSTTCNCWRHTFEPFNDIFHMPSMIFTLCDLPSFSGYGSNSTSVVMLSSQLLALWTRAYFHHNNVLTEAQIATFMIMYDSVVKDSKSWVPLQAVEQLLKKEFNKSSQVNIFQFAFVTSLSAVADTVGDSLPAANAKIAINIFARFSDLLLDN